MTQKDEAKKAVNALIAAGWSTTRIAARLDVSESAVRYWMGDGCPRRQTMAKLAKLVESVRK